MVIRVSAGSFMAVALAAAALAAASMPALAQTCEFPEPDAGERIFSTRIGERVLEAQALQVDEEFGASIQVLDRAIEDRRANAYERAVALQMRGRAYYEIDNIDAAASDWLSAIATGSLTTEEITNLSMNIGQLLIFEGRYDEGVDQLECAASLAGNTLSPRFQRMMAQAYAQAERFDEGRVWLDHFWTSGAPEAREIDAYRLRLYYLRQLDLVDGQLAHLREMIVRWPDEKSHRQTYMTALVMAGEERAAFDVSVEMYELGMLTGERELLRLIQYYGFYEMPDEGLATLQRETEAGRITDAGEILWLTADLNAQAGRWAEAREAAELLVARNPSEHHHRLLALTLLNTGELERAEAQMRSAIQSNEAAQTPNERLPRLYELLADILDARGDTSGAAVARERASEEQSLSWFWNSCQDVLIQASLDERVIAQTGAQDYEPVEVPPRCREMDEHSRSAE